MPQILVRHKVKDFDKWKASFDEDEPRRKAAVSKGCSLFFREKDRNDVIVLCEWDDLGRAHRFAESDVTRERIERAGMIDRPEVHFLPDIERPAA